MTIARGHLTFQGKRTNLVIDSPRVVSVGVIESDRINLWVTVAGADGHEVLFADGSRLGWGGVRGGTQQAADEIDLAQR